MEGSGDHGPFGGEEVGVGAFGEFGGEGEAAIAFVEVATAGDEGVVLDEGAVVGATGAGGGLGALAGFEGVAGAEGFHAGGGVFGVGVAAEGIDGEAVGGPADERGVLVGFEVELVHDGFWEAVIVVGAAGLDMGVIFIETERDSAAEGFVVPVGGAVAIPEFGGAGVEEDAIEGDAEGLVGRALGNAVFGGEMERGDLAGGGWGSGQGEGVGLGFDAVGVAAIGEGADEVIGDGVGFDVAGGALESDLGGGGVGRVFVGGDEGDGLGFGGAVLAHGRRAAAEALGMSEGLGQKERKAEGEETLRRPKNKEYGMHHDETNAEEEA